MSVFGHIRGGTRYVALTACLLLLGAGSASAVPILATPGDFDGSETLLTFDSIAQDEEITTQFAAFSVIGGLFGDTIAAPGFMGSGTAASNFEAASPPFFDVIDVVFTTPVSRFRFDAITNGADDVEIEVFSGGGGSFNFVFNTSTTPSSIAILDPDAILAIQIRIVGTGNHAFALDNLEYAVPEPGLALLVLVGLGAALRPRR